MALTKNKHRYLLVRSSVGIDALNAYDIKKALFEKLGMRFHLAALKIISMQGNYLIIRCSLKSFDDVVAALTMIKNINGSRIAFYTIKSSGTIKSLQKGISA
ncbi:MAG: Rpp14/Pop5 family protein [Candidatus Micrarchaeaceae archaeon]